MAALWQHAAMDPQQQELLRSFSMQHLQHAAAIQQQLTLSALAQQYAGMQRAAVHHQQVHQHAGEVAAAQQQQQHQQHHHQLHQQHDQHHHSHLQHGGMVVTGTPAVVSPSAQALLSAQQQPPQQQPPQQLQPHGGEADAHPLGASHNVVIAVPPPGGLAPGQMMMVDQGGSQLATAAQAVPTAASHGANLQAPMPMAGGAPAGASGEHHHAPQGVGAALHPDGEGGHAVPPSHVPAAAAAPEAQAAAALLPGMDLGHGGAAAVAAMAEGGNEGVHMHLDVYGQARGETGSGAMQVNDAASSGAMQVVQEPAAAVAAIAVDPQPDQSGHVPHVPAAMLPPPAEAAAAAEAAPPAAALADTAPGAGAGLCLAQLAPPCASAAAEAGVVQHDAGIADVSATGAIMGSHHDVIMGDGSGQGHCTQVHAAAEASHPPVAAAAAAAGPSVAGGSGTMAGSTDANATGTNGSADAAASPSAPSELLALSKEELVARVLALEALLRSKVRDWGVGVGRVDETDGSCQPGSRVRCTVVLPPQWLVALCSKMTRCLLLTAEHFWPVCLLAHAWFGHCRMVPGAR